MYSIVSRFVLLGPVVGCLGFVLADQLLSVTGLRSSTLAEGGDIGSLLLSIPLLWLYGMLMAHLLGGFPAVLTGLAYAWYLRRKKHNISFYLRFVVGAGLGLIFGGLIGVLFSKEVMAVIPWLAAGALGGSVAASSVGSRLFERASLVSNLGHIA